ncbi:hypothetical protein GQ53DRAFT_311323 [Thozetella sp. PMI_491]|nr:hypothetical protein GQ53DRAFT_311323 [Thozetella sp. PMI_491]
MKTNRYLYFAVYYNSNTFRCSDLARWGWTGHEWAFDGGFASSNHFSCIDGLRRSFSVFARFLRYHVFLGGLVVSRPLSKRAAPFFQTTKSQSSRSWVHEFIKKRHRGSCCKSQHSVGHLGWLRELVHFFFLISCSCFHLFSLYQAMVAAANPLRPIVLFSTRYYTGLHRELGRVGGTRNTWLS